MISLLLFCFFFRWILILIFVSFIIVALIVNSWIFDHRSSQTFLPMFILNLYSLWGKVWFRLQIVILSLTKDIKIKFCHEVKHLCVKTQR